MTFLLNWFMTDIWIIRFKMNFSKQSNRDLPCDMHHEFNEVLSHLSKQHLNVVFCNLNAIYMNLFDWLIPCEITWGKEFFKPPVTDLESCMWCQSQWFKNITFFNLFLITLYAFLDGFCLQNFSLNISLKGFSFR